MFGGLGGKKKRVAAGIKLLNPANGQAIVVGSGEVRKTSISFAGGNAWTAGATASGYAASKDGKMLVEAFVKAFNAVTAQSPVIAAMPKAQPVAAAPANSGATVAVVSVLRRDRKGDWVVRGGTGRGQQGG